MVVYFQVSNQNFLTQDNIRTVSQFAAATAIIAAGEVMLLICGEIDLSAGMVFAFAPFIMFFSYQAGLPIWIAIIFGLLASAAVGLFNGLITVLLKVPSFITTLGTLFLLEGITLTISNGFPALTPNVGALNQVFGNSPYSEIIWAIAIVIVMQIVLSFTKWGLHTVATGSNLLGASETGVNVNRVKIGNFILCSVFGGFAGILEGFRITSIDPLAGGTPIMFAAVAGAVIGGTSLMGGLGTIVGAFLGVLVLSILNDGFTLLGVSAFTFDIILGAAILIAMILNVRLQLLREAGRQ
jgi:simple sugar transport system permease protein